MALRVVSLPAAASRMKNEAISAEVSHSPSTSAATSAVVRSSPGLIRRSSAGVAGPHRHALDLDLGEEPDRRLTSQGAASPAKRSPISCATSSTMRSPTAGSRSTVVVGGGPVSLPSHPG